ncbi:MAG TPA: hypothetical protein VMZ28_28350 [Kofleriaceae bacterium]|nr:hypothetical protein [Kofleriaceae bacterium]
MRIASVTLAGLLATACGDGLGAAADAGAVDAGAVDAADPDGGRPDAGPLECPAGHEGVPVEEGGDGCVLQNPRLTAPSRLVRGRTFTLRAQILGEDGNVDPTGCAGLGAVSLERVADGASVPITVTTFDDHTAVPDDAIRFVHGVGSVSFTLDDGDEAAPGAYRLVVEVGDLRATNVIDVLPAPAWRVMPAVLTGDDLVWGPDEQIRIVEHDTLVPAGATLRIHPGTSVMVDTTGGLEDGTLLHVAGRVEAVGELDRAIHIFSQRGPAAMTHTVAGASLSNPDAWRGIAFTGTGTSTLRWVILTGAGNGVVTSHPRPPILNLLDTHDLVVEDSVFTDSTGMMFQSPGTGSYVIRRSLVSRVGIGAEFLSSGHTLLIEDSWWTGIGHGPTEPIRFDGDGIHLDGFDSDQTLRRCVVADVGDDAIDHSYSTFTIEATVVQDAVDKAVSMTEGQVTISDSLLFGAPTGVRGAALVRRSTIATGEPILTPVLVDESVIWPGTIGSCDGDVDHSIVGDEASLGCGDGNLSVDPAWTDAAACDYTPAAGSPALTAGAGGGLIGWPGYPAYTP